MSSSRSSILLVPNCSGLHFSAEMTMTCRCGRRGRRWQYYVVGSTNSTTFPVTQGAYMSGGGGFAAKISADGRSLIYSTYLNNAATGLAVNSVGQATSWGRASRVSTRPVRPMFLMEAPFWERRDSRLANVRGLDAVGNVYLAGTTGATNIPTTANAFQPSLSATPHPARTVL